MMKISIGKLATSVDVDESLFNETVRARVFEYGLTQMLNDCHSGVTAVAFPDAAARAHAVSEAVAGKIADLYAGRLRSTGGGRTGDPIMQRAMVIALAKIKKAYKTKPTAWNDQMAGEGVDHTKPADRAKWFSQRARIIAPKYRELAATQVATEGNEIDVSEVGL